MSHKHNERGGDGHLSNAMGKCKGSTPFSHSEDGTSKGGERS